MSWWEKVKDKIPKLADIKIKLLPDKVNLNITVNIANRTYNRTTPVPSGVEPQAFEGFTTTQEWEKEYLERFKEVIDAKMKSLPSRPDEISDEKLNEIIVDTSSTSALDVITSKVGGELGFSGEVKARQIERSVNGETGSVIAPVRSTGPPKKPWPSDEGETM